MTRREKLAREYALSLYPMGDAYFESVHLQGDEYPRDLRAAAEVKFTAGFKAALDEAAKVCAQEYTTGIAMERIRALAEEDAP